MDGSLKPTLIERFTITVPPTDKFDPRQAELRAVRPAVKIAFPAELILSPNSVFECADTNEPSATDSLRLTQERKRDDPFITIEPSTFMPDPTCNPPCTNPLPRQLMSPAAIMLCLTLTLPDPAQSEMN
jgi:hypothetical protein